MQLQQLKYQLEPEPALDTSQKEEREILSIAIDVGNGKEETIEVAKGDNPDLLASVFCVKHGLNERQRLKLAKLIEKHMEEAVQSGMKEEDLTE